MNQEERVNDLIFICERMIEILTSENAGLRKFETDSMKDRLEEKTKLSLFYERHMKSLQKNRDAFKDIDKETLDTLRELGEEMNELLDENGRLLKIAMDANRRIFKHIAQAAQEQSPQNQSYAQNGGVEGSQAHKPVSLNQEL